MPSKPRLPTNVIACLEDCQAILLDVWPAVSAASQRAEERYLDPVLLADLSRITRALSSLEHHIRNARQNHYQQRRSL